MHRERIELWQHQHTFNIEKRATEKRTFIVVAVTLVTMTAEIAFGLMTNSMALFADGWHMGTHAFALGVSLLAYVLARRYARDRRFTFGTWKIEILGAYTSAIVLGIVACYMIFTSIERVVHPLPIRYDEALIVAIIGLLINLACAIILNTGTHAHASHGHEHGHEHHDHMHDDLNLKSAYLHVVADAVTSVLAIAALLGAKLLRIQWLDPFMGLVGAGLIIRWAALLLKDTGSILLEHGADGPVAHEIAHAIESDGDSKICDLHLWKVAQNKYACILSIVAKRKYTLDEYRTRLRAVHELAHITIEINKCKGKKAA
ncbi:MAG: CDF family Co(II)/Ni(II) efflux transporter DmeF [Spirochaetota bacterium]